MKAKVSRGGGFLGALNYVFDMGEDATGDKKPEHCGGNMCGDNPRELSREFGLTKKLRPDCEKPVWHCSLALPVGERLSAEKWGEISSAFMLAMGMDPANFLYIVERHNDKPNDHVHIVASRIGLDSSLWHGGRDVFTAIEATQKLEKQFGLTLTAGFDPAHKKEIKPVTSAELNMALRLEMKPPRMICQEAIEEVLKNKGELITAPDFINRLSDLGVRAVPSVASTGAMNGFSFETAGVAFTGSKLGESFKWLQLQKRGVKYDKDRDFAALADARASARERAAAGSDAGRELGEAGRDHAPGAEPGAVAEPSSRAGDGSHAGAGPDSEDARGREPGVGGLRPSDRGAAVESGSDGAGDQRPSDSRHGAEGRELGQGLAGSGQPGAGVEINGGQHGEKQQRDGSIAGRVDKNGSVFGEADAERSKGFDQRGALSKAENLQGSVADARQRIDGRTAGGDWAIRFKQNSASKRVAEERGVGRNSVGQVVGAGAKVAESDRIEARQIDPTDYLTAQGFDVRKEGKHLSVRQHGDEVYRCTLKDGGHWVTCDKHENGIGDNIALVQELEPGTGFADSVYRLSGAPSVARATRPAPAPVLRQPPTMPAQAEQDVQRGREYLFERGITLETIEHAEQSGMLRYSAGAVLFVGRDEHGAAQNITRRAVDASEAVQKRDLKGTDKRHPQMLPGSAETVFVVEGGIDGLAAHDIARREGRPVPTVIVSGGSNVRAWIETPWVQRVLKLAKKVVVAFEREKSPEVQAKTDAAHELQMQRLREVCGATVEGWKPPEGVKDIAALNSHQVQEAAQPARSHPAPGMRG